MDKKQLSNRTISTFEIIGAFVVDLYYNHFYQEAKRLRLIGKAESVTEGYKHAVSIYLMSLNNPESYKKTIVGLHKYYYTTTRFTGISFSECINEIVRHFIPDDFFESTTNIQRDGILKQILSQSVKQFSSDIVCGELLHIIIDKHSDKFIVRKLQDKMVYALMHERELLFQKFFKGSNKTNTDVNYDMINKLKGEIVKLVKTNSKLVKDNKKLETDVNNLKKTKKEPVSVFSNRYSNEIDEENIIDSPVFQRTKNNITPPITEIKTTQKQISKPEITIKVPDTQPVKKFNTVKPILVQAVIPEPIISTPVRPIISEQKTLVIPNPIISEQKTTVIPNPIISEQKTSVIPNPIISEQKTSVIPSPVCPDIYSDSEPDLHVTSEYNSPIVSEHTSPIVSPKGDTVQRKNNSNFFGFDF